MYIYMSKKVPSSTYVAFEFQPQVHFNNFNNLERVDVTQGRALGRQVILKEYDRIPSM